MPRNVFFRSFFRSFYLGFILAVLVMGCSNSDDFPGQTSEISDEDAVIVFSAANWPDVVFQHRSHSEYWDNNCFECHSHTDVRDETQWKCSECHSNEDSDNLCADDAEGHDCMYVQCFKCHQTLEIDPTPDCSDCHIINASNGQFVDSFVGGLVFSTSGLRGVTDSQGRFQFNSGDTISFSIGDIILGSGEAKPVMTPIDLVPGALDETNQTVTNIARFLQSLDADNDLSNGITIPNEILNVIENTEIDFTVPSLDFESNPELQEILTALDKTLVDEDDAQAHLRSTLLIFNSAPVASDATITGSLVVDQTISGLYTFADADNDEEGESLYKWYLADDAMGTNPTEISNETFQTYTLVGTDVGKFIIFEVTPVASSGTIIGAVAQSLALGPISLNPTNLAPTATSCAVDGPANTHFVLSANYNYSDIDGDQEQGSTHRWYSADDASGTNETLISGTDGLSFNPRPEDTGKFLIFKVTPAAANGNSPGLTCASTAIGPVTGDSTVLIFGSIFSMAEVDTYTIRLTDSTDVTIDVESSEKNHYGWNNIGGLNFPKDLGFPDGGTNGSGNDQLTSNIYFFSSDGTALDFREGTALCYACSNCHGGYKGQPTPGFPGCGAPDAFYTRNPLNPYMDLNALSAGDYVLAVGAQNLTETDAWLGTNSGSEISGWADPGSGFFNNYKITFSFK